MLGAMSDQFHLGLLHLSNEDVSQGPLTMLQSLSAYTGGSYAIGPLGKVNLILGANNSGKSRLLRALHSIPQFALVREPVVQAIAGCIDAISGIEQWLDPRLLITLFAYERTSHTTSFGHEQIAALKRDLDELGHRPGLLPYFVSSVAAFKTWTDELVSTARPINSDHFAREIRIASAKLPEHLRPALATIHMRDDLKEEDKALIDRCANHTLLRTAFLVTELQFLSLSTSNGILPKEMLTPLHELAFDLADQIEALSPACVYVPVLRTMHTLTDAADDLYLSAIRRLYKMSPKGTTKQGASDNDAKQIFTGMNLYRRFLRDRGGPRQSRRRFQEFEAFLGETFFGGKLVDIVAQYADPGDELIARHVRVNIGETEHALHDLGDGIQTLILLLYPIFMADDDTWFFVEEPEIHLHPGLQRVFMESLLTHPTLQGRGFVYFFTTHSNHFLETAATNSGEVAVLSLMRGEPEHSFAVTSRHVPTVDELDQLGVRNASVLLANCTIWVEGIADRLYLRAYLQAYFQYCATTQMPHVAFKEDVHYAFFEYAGSNIVHYDIAAAAGAVDVITLAKISARALVIADLDHGKDAEHAMRGAQAREAGVEYVTTAPCIEIENLLSTQIVRKVIKSLQPKKFRELKPDELGFDEDRRARIRFGTYLTESLRVQIPRADLESRRELGPVRAAAGVVEDLAPPLDRVEVAGEHAADELGRTLQSSFKTELAVLVGKLAARGELAWDMLSPEAQLLTRRVVEFIARHNRVA